jgi:tetratricopeptide (TPR) repeat protein
MWARLFAHLVGYDRYKGRGDRLYLAGVYTRAFHAYRQARALLADTDLRVPAVDALLRECAERTGLADRQAFHSEPGLSSEPAAPFHPGLSDLYELAIAGKDDARARLYRGQGADFKAGYVALVRGEGKEAVRLLSLSARGGAPSFVKQLELGRALSLVGELSEAARALEKALQLSPRDPEALNLLAAVQVEQGSFDSALQTLSPLEPLLQSGRAGAEALFISARALAGRGERELALERLRQAVAKESGFHEAYFLGGELLLAGGDVPDAFEAFRTACSIEPEEVLYNRSLARLVLDRRLAAEVGLAACDRLMVTDEENRWEYLCWIAELYLQRGWRREARDPLQKALDLLPGEKSEERRRILRQLAELDREAS